MMSGSLTPRGVLFLLVCAFSGITVVEAQQPIEISGQNSVVNSDYTQAQMVEYKADFFDRYQPDTALDMVRQLPGFQLDDGTSSRGFTAAAGNILINGRRPSAKDDVPSAILTRIAADQVGRIELIRGQIRGVDVRGQTVIANIILKSDGPASIRWETAVRRNFIVDRLLFRGNVSLSDRWAGVDYNTGLTLDRSSTGEIQTEEIYDGTGIITEKRFEDSVERGYKGSVNLNAATWFGDTLARFNTRIYYETEDEPVISSRFPQVIGSSSRQELYHYDRKVNQIEIGTTLERHLSPDLLSKAIILFINDNYDEITSQQSLDMSGNQTQFREANTGTITTEAIGRLEFDWSGLMNHAIQLNLEGAYNALDGSLVQTQDSGTGPMPVNVPGANTRVEEVRGDFLLKDTWLFGQFELDYGLGAEVSTISQSGDEELERDFFFLKPHAIFIYSPSQGKQTRLRLARTVAQLNFKDFVSAVVFQDDNLALGNPNLRPDTTWVAELSHERRFGAMTVVKATLFHHWISDVLDLLPITPMFEVPGNIGDGKRWGLEVETTIPLEWLGLTEAKLDVKARWQDSSVTDPVTGQHRSLSGRKGFGGNPYISFRDQNRYALIIDYRQDFQQARVAWGWNAGTRDKRILYKVSELDVYDESVALNAFVETTRWFNLKMRVVAENITNMSQVRDRSVYSGERAMSTVNFRELETGNEGFRLTYSLSGSF
jgi:hypothetical protein